MQLQTILKLKSDRGTRFSRDGALQGINLVPVSRQEPIIMAGLAYRRT
jgi:hypothetical protein